LIIYIFFIPIENLTIICFKTYDLI